MVETIKQDSAVANGDSLFPDGMNASEMPSHVGHLNDPKSDGMRAIACEVCRSALTARRHAYLLQRAEELRSARLEARLCRSSSSHAQIWCRASARWKEAATAVKVTGNEGYDQGHSDLTDLCTRRLGCVALGEWTVDEERAERAAAHIGLGDSNIQDDTDGSAFSSASCGYGSLSREPVACGEREVLKHSFLHKLSVSELVGMCKVEGIDCADAVEKDDLVDRLVQRILE